MGIFVIVFLLLLFCLLYFSFHFFCIKWGQEFIHRRQYTSQLSFKKSLRWDFLVDFDGVLVNSRMARQGSLFSLLHFLIMYFICFTADSTIPLEFGISGELGFHLNLYLWASSLIILLSNSGPLITYNFFWNGISHEVFPYQFVQPDDIP